jgi:hypothetical protein
MEAFIELIQEEEREKHGSSYIPPSQEHPAGPRTESSPPANFNTPNATCDNRSVSAQEAPTSNQSQTVGHKADNSSYDKPWTCPTCTLENPSNFLCCDVCAAERPPPTNTQPKSTSTSGNTSNQPPRSVSRGSTKRSLPPDQPDDDKKNTKDTFAFKNRTRAKDSLKRLDEGVNKKPLGWVCTSCSSFMETQWWTCSCCGTMKPYS